MTVKDIIVEYLKEHGYDGLCYPDSACSCCIDDLCACEGDPCSCVPGKKRINDDGDWEIVSE